MTLRAPAPPHPPIDPPAPRDRPRRAAVNASWLLVDRLVRMGVGLVVGVLVARHLGVTNFGLLNYATALVGLLAGFATLGLESILLRDLVRTPERRAALLGTAAGLRLLGGVVCLILSLAAATLLRPNDPTALAVVGLVAIGTVLQVTDVVDLWAQARSHTRPVVLARLLAFSIATVVRVALLRQGAGVTAFAALVGVEALLTALALLGTYATLGGPRWRWRREEAGRLLRDGWPLMLSGMAILVYMRVDMLMLESAGLDEVGIYGAATRISEAWYFVPTALVAAMAPGITAAQHTDPAGYLARIRRLSGLLGALAIAVALGLSLLSAPIIHFLFGAEFEASAAVLAVHAWAGVFVALGLAQGVWNVCEGLTRLALARTVAGAMLNVVLNLVLIPSLGSLGAAVATVISYALSAYVLNAFDRRTRVIFRIQTDALLLRALFSPRASGTSR